MKLKIYTKLKLVMCMYEVVVGENKTKKSLLEQIQDYILWKTYLQWR